MNIKHELNAIAERMQLWVNELGDSPLTIREEWHMHEQMKKDAEHLRDIATSMKDPDLYIGDRLKAAIVLGQARVFFGEPDARTRAFMEMMTQEELELFLLFRARHEHHKQAYADWLATKRKGPLPCERDYGLTGTSEADYMCAVSKWLMGAQDTPRPQKSDFGL